MDAAPSGAARAFHEGSAHLQGGAHDLARASFEQAVALDPALAEAWANLGWLAAFEGDTRRAAQCYEQSLALRADLYSVRLNYGTLLMGQRLLDETEVQFSAAVKLQADAPGGWSNLGGLYAAWGRDVEAELCCRQALLRDASHAMARLNLAYVLLRQGRWAEGWPLLESRDWYAGLQARLPCPRWQGEPLQDQHVLVAPEAGYGDVIQFSRYAALLRRQGARRVTLLCAPPLQPLLATLEGLDEVRSWDLPADPSWDVWVPLLSLPHRLGTRVDTVPARIPYLRVPAARREECGAWVGPRLEDRSPGAPARASSRFRVGLVWRGSAGFENDAERSLPDLRTLQPLWSLPSLQFVSLQKGAGEDEALAPPPGQPLQAVGHRIRDFADTAALIESVDLVITVDTSTAHLAGALGRSCWVLLPAYMTDWRWLQGRDDSPWYPGVMRLFRQTARGNWDAVVASVVQALAEWAQHTP